MSKEVDPELIEGVTKRLNEVINIPFLSEEQERILITAVLRMLLTRLEALNLI